MDTSLELDRYILLKLNFMIFYLISHSVKLKCREFLYDMLFGNIISYLKLLDQEQRNLIVWDE